MNYLLNMLQYISFTLFQFCSWKDWLVIFNFCKVFDITSYQGYSDFIKWLEKCFLFFEFVKIDFTASVNVWRSSLVKEFGVFCVGRGGGLSILLLHFTGLYIFSVTFLSVLTSFAFQGIYLFYLNFPMWLKIFFFFFFYNLYYLFDICSICNEMCF